MDYLRISQNRKQQLEVLADNAMPVVKKGDVKKGSFSQRKSKSDQDKENYNPQTGAALAFTGPACCQIWQVCP